MVWAAFEEARVADWRHEVMQKIHVDEEMQSSRMYKHRCKLGVVDITSG
jgi:hypothetical protein